MVQTKLSVMEAGTQFLTHLWLSDMKVQKVRKRSSRYKNPEVSRSPEVEKRRPTEQ